MRRPTPIIFLLLIFYFSISGNSLAQKTLTISLVSENPDAESDASWFEEKVREEIGMLLKNKLDINFETNYTNYDLSKMQTAFEQAFADPNIDIVISIGVMSSSVLANLKNYPKPAIASIIIDRELQQIPLTTKGSSGLNNFTYVQSPFSMERDIKALYRLKSFKKIGIIGGSNLITYMPFLSQLVGKICTGLGVSYTIIPFAGSVENTLSGISPDINAIYALPIYDEISEQGLSRFFQAINDRGLASVALLGLEYLEKGALLGYDAHTNIQRLPRRIAINVLKIVEGENPANLPVLIPTYSEDLLINMAAAAASSVYPDFDFMASATLLNLHEINTDRKLSLKSAIIEGLQNNLDLKISSLNPQIAQTDLDLARAELRPQVDVSTSLALIDENRAASSFGTQGRLNWLASGSLSQVIFSEPALANITIQKLLKQGREEELEQTQLDVVVDVASAYLDILKAKTFVQIQNENVAVTRENYNISKAKEAVGYAGASDLYRWQSELALKNIDLNDANAQLQQAKYRLNQLLNRPINEAFQTEEVTLEDQMLVVTDPRMFTLINNYGDLATFSDFLVKEAIVHLPELKQLDLSIAAQQRLQRSQERAFYLPAAVLSGTVDQTLKKFEVVGDLPPATNKAQWSLGLGLQYPIMQGGKRRFNVEQSRLSIQQIKSQKVNLQNQLELRVRAAIEIAGASYSRVELSREAADAGKANFDIVQDAYSQGLVQITALIDAQNAALQTEIAAINAIYQFITDFLLVERATGYYYFLSTPEEQDSFFERLIFFITAKERIRK